MKAFLKWAESHDPLFVFTYHDNARLAPYALKLLNVVRDEFRPSENFPQPDLATWLRLYKDHRLVRRVSLGLSEIGSVTPPSTNDGRYNPFVTQGESLVGTAAEILNFERETKYISKNLWFINSLDEPFERNVTESRLKEKMLLPEFYFNLRIYFPCWLLYRETPFVLLRRARLGDINALDRLLRLDSSVAFDPKISKLIHSYRGHDKRKYEVVHKAQAGQPKVKVTIQKIKIFLAGYLSDISAGLGKRLNASDIRSLFDAIAKDDGVGEVDTDLPESLEAFSKAIQREINFWKNV